ncbi:MAG TPA: hypothetical protein VER12_01095 [Polyangiaceae bacterium]|nr:hypothetical protein [Polyangiaceae bacterium]
MRKGLGQLLVLAASITALGCSEKDATKCQEALDGTRKSVAASDLVLTSQWRERSYKYCEDQAALATLDKEITTKQSAEAAAKAAEAQRLALNAGLIKTFVTWAGDNRVAPDHASVSPKCDGDDPDPAAPKKPTTDPAAAERFCTATRTAGTSTLSARYWDADKSIVLFSTKVPAPASCDDLGPNKVLKSWEVPATTGQGVKRTRCELSGGTLAGMHAVVSAAANASVYIFSPSYLLKDPAMKKIAGE